MLSPVEYVYDNAKSAWLRRQRGLGFEEIIEYIDEGCALAIVHHPNQKSHFGQRIYEVNIEGYIYEVPFYEEGKKHILKTLYPSRKATKKHLDKGILL